MDLSSVKDKSELERLKGEALQEKYCIIHEMKSHMSLDC
jgi:hypothetical protein